MEVLQPPQIDLVTDNEQLQTLISERLKDLEKTHEQYRLMQERKTKLYGSSNPDVPLSSKTFISNIRDVDVKSGFFIEVPMSQWEENGILVTGIGRQILYTKSMADCRAILVMFDKNPETNIYNERRMIHLPGGWYNDETFKEIFQGLEGDRQKDARIVVAFGFNSPEKFSESYLDRIREDLRRLKLNISVPLEKTFTVLESRGSIMLKPDGTCEQISRESLP